MELRVLNDRRLTAAAPTLVVACFLTADAMAQGAGLTPEKRALIKELNEISNLRANSVEIYERMSVQFEQQMARLRESTIDAMDDLTREERDDLKRQMAESAERTSKRIDELLAKELDLAQITEDVSYQLYDKYFTEQEVRDLIVFYKTPTGKKSIEVMPRLFAESAAMTAELMMPKMERIIAQLSEEEKKRVAETMATLPKPRPKPAAKRTRRRP